MNVWPLLSKWEVKRLEELSSAIQYGYTAKATTKRLGPKLLRITDIQNDSVDWDSVPFCEISPKEIEKYRLGKNDLLFARTGATVGKSYLIRDPVPDSVFASYLIRVRLTGEVAPKYIAYFFKSTDYWRQITERQAGIGQPNVNGTKLAQIEIPVAPANQQQLIVAEIEKQFSRLDEAVANLKRVKVNLKRYKAAVLKAAVEGKLTEEWRKQHPNVEPAGKLLERILTDRRAKWNDKGKYKEPFEPDTTGFPLLPEGWIWAPLGSITEAVGGFAFESKKFTLTGFQVLKMANVRMGRIDLDQKPSFIQNVEPNVIARYGLMDGDLVVTLTGTRKKQDYGYVAVVKNAKSVLLNQRIARLRPADGVLPEFLAFVMQSEEYRNRFFAYETGNVGQGNVGIGAVTKEPIRLSPFAEQQYIVAEVERRLSVIEELEAAVEANLIRADRLRQSILSQAFSGRLLMQLPLNISNTVHTQALR